MKLDKLKSISFENYKAFKEKQNLEIRPITLLIGKNSSGKSAVAKLFTLLENSLSENIKEPLLLNNNGVELGAEFLDLVYGKVPNSPIKFSFITKSNQKMSVSVFKPINDFFSKIYEWACSDFFEEGKGIYYSVDKGLYIDGKKRNREPIFRGFDLFHYSDIEIEEGIFIDEIYQPYTFGGFLDIDYIGPFRVLPKRMFDMVTPIRSEKTGIQGENAYNYLIRSEIEKTELIKNVGQWYKDHFDGWELKVSTKRSPYFEILLCKEVNGQDLEINIADTGQGISQALPLVVRAYTKVEDSIVVLEQPELHLHPAAHADLAELFAWSAKTYNQNFVIETHSENMLLRLRKLVVENNLVLQ